MKLSFLKKSRFLKINKQTQRSAAGGSTRAGVANVKGVEGQAGGMASTKCQAVKRRDQHTKCEIYE